MSCVMHGLCIFFLWGEPGYAQVLVRCLTQSRPKQSLWSVRRNALQSVQVVWMCCEQVCCSFFGMCTCTYICVCLTFVWMRNNKLDAWDVPVSTCWRVRFLVRYISVLVWAMCVVERWENPRAWKWCGIYRDDVDLSTCLCVYTCACVYYFLVVA